MESMMSEVIVKTTRWQVLVANMVPFQASLFEADEDGRKVARGWGDVHFGDSRVS